MDDTKDTAPGSSSGGAASGSGPGARDPREELRDQLQVMGRAAGDLLEQLVKVPGTLAQIPLQALPEDTATHARNAATEGFAAVRTLLDSMTRGIDQMMREQRERMANMGSTHTGVGGAASGTDASAAGGTGTHMLNAGSAPETTADGGATTKLDVDGNGS